MTITIMVTVKITKMIIMTVNTSWLPVLLPPDPCPCLRLCGVGNFDEYLMLLTLLHVTFVPWWKPCIYSVMIVLVLLVMMVMNEQRIVSIYIKYSTYPNAYLQCGTCDAPELASFTSHASLEWIARIFYSTTSTYLLSYLAVPTYYTKTI